MDASPLFPEVEDIREFDAIARDEARLRPGAEAVCRSLGLAPTGLARFADGSLPVYAVDGERVLKLYPPFERNGRDRERLALGVLEGRLPVETPRVLAAGDLEGWGYLLMSRLRGEGLAGAWPEIGTPDRVRLVRRLGEALAALHRLADPRLDALRGEWDRFLPAQRAGAAARQRERGLEERWVEQIPSFLDAVDLRGAPAVSLLHTEVMREHLLVSRGPCRPELSGLFDFEPAMVGPPEYEFASVGLFVSGGDATLLRELLLAYGYAPSDLDEALQQRLLAYAILHRYSRLRWYLERVPPPRGVRTLPALAGHWWRLA